MKYLRHFLLIILVFIIQIAIVPNITIKLAFPNLILIVCIALALNFKYEESLLWAVIGGLLLDVYSPMRFGINTITLVALSSIVYFTFRKFISQPIMPIVFVVFFVMSLLYDLVPYLLYSKDIKVYFFDAIYNTIIGVIVYYFLNSMKSKNNQYQITV